MLFTFGAKKRGVAIQLLLTSIIFSMSANSYGDSGDTGKVMSDVQCVIPNQNAENEYRAIFRIHKLGVVAIPCLIEHIDSPDKIYLKLTNPVISTLLPGDSQLQYAGIRYAYVIQLIILKAVLVGHGDRKVQFTLGDARNYLYPHGLIARRDGAPLDVNDMVSIKAIYQEWWKKNQFKPVDELRKDWSDSWTPLSGTIYHWE